MITVIAVLIISPDSLIVRLIDSDHWTVLFWRGIFVSAGMIVALVLFYRTKTLRQFINIGSAGLMLIVLFTASTLFFVTALSFTSVANTLVIIATAPIFAALFSWIILNESINKFTALTIIVVLLSIFLIVAEGQQQGSLLGDLCAFGTAVSIAGSFVVTRQSKQINMIPAIALSSALTALIAYLMADNIFIDSRQFNLFIVLGLILTVGMGLLIVGPRYITAPQVSLLLPLETVFGTLLVWMLIGEVPSSQTIAGGAIILVFLTLNSIHSMRQSKAKL